MTRETEMDKVQHRAQNAAEKRILDALLPPPRARFANEPVEADGSRTETRQKFRKMFRATARRSQSTPATSTSIWASGSRTRTWRKFLQC